jgi:hypothetical protein
LYIGHEREELVEQEGTAMEAVCDLSHGGEDLEEAQVIFPFLGSGDKEVTKPGVKDYIHYS